MLAGKHVFATMMTAMWGHASVQLRHIDLSGQRQIRGPALEQLLGPRGIPTLEVLSLKGCSSVTGSVPLSIANSKQLHSLNLHGCKHHGPFPVALLELEAMYFLDIANNQFEGKLPETLCDLICRLERYDFRGNRFNVTTITGWVACNVRSLRKNRTEINCNGIGLKGEVRLPLFERLCDLDRIDFKGNPDIDTTTLVGWLTCNMETLNNLSELDASGIGVTGFIPRCLLLKQSNLRNVNLSSNRLTGPTVWEVIKLLSPCASSLEKLNLSCNKLGGALPEKGMWEFIELRELDLTNTGVSGPISKDLEHLTALQFIALSRNSFEGGVSEAFFGLLRRLDRFEMRGVISPASVLDSVACNSTRLDNIIRINASSQELRGEIPSVIGELSTLQSLDLSNNNLEGAIPSSLGKLLSLRQLYLNFNALSGEIPAALGQCTALENLFLSRNRLHGIRTQRSETIKYHNVCHAFVVTQVAFQRASASSLRSWCFDLVQTVCRGRFLTVLEIWPTSPSCGSHRTSSRGSCR